MDKAISELGSSALKLVLLPGMDGTAELFTSFIEALPRGLDAITVSYPRDQYLSYVELERLVRLACPSTEPFVLLAESFSTPLAVQYAAAAPENMRGLILCTGFTTSPVHGWMRTVGTLLAPLLVRLPLPNAVINILLLGRKAPASAAAALRETISSVQPDVLAARLRAVFACDMRAALSQVATPILYIRAKNDRLIGALCREEVLRCNSAVDVVSIEGPHLVIQREPRGTADIVASYVQRLSAIVPSVPGASRGAAQRKE